MSILLGIGAVTTMAGAVYGGNLVNGIHAFKWSIGEPENVRSPRYKVSLLVPAYNESKYIGRLIQSAHRQSEPIAEIIVADCSDPFEGTAEVVHSMGATVVPVDRGNISASRNIAAEASSGEILLFADADVHLPNNLVELAIDSLESGKLAVHPKQVMYDSIGWTAISFLHLGLIRAKTRTTCCVVTTRNTWEGIGGYDEECNPITGNCREDLDFGKRIARTYGRDALGVLPTCIGTSARRQKKNGLTFGLSDFDDAVRSRPLG